MSHQSVSPERVPRHDLLGIPRRRRPLLEACRSWPLVGGWIVRIQRAERKRFLARIRGGGAGDLIREVQRHPAGREFQTALDEWVVKPSKPVPVAGRLARPEPGCRCSVIINTVDRAADLALTLAAFREVCDVSRDELIIVLGPTEDESEEVVRRSGVPCRLIRCPEKNLAVSRNLGWQAAQGRYLAFIDDDASPDTGWLGALLDPFERDPQVGVTAGFVLDGRGVRHLNRYVVADTLGRAYWLEDAAAAAAKTEELRPLRAFVTATGCNMAFRRSLLDEIGGFDPFYRYFLEETDAVLRVLATGARCVVTPASRVFHRLGSNVARQPSFDPETRSVVIRSQIHYIGKFGKTTFPPEAIRACLWERVLLDLEKIAWDHAGSAGSCGDLQAGYLQRLTTEFKLDSAPDSSSLPPPPSGGTNAL
jgi:GT2 family glycosyltransferase